MECNNANRQITELFRTATEICELMYAPDSSRTPKAVLRLHNLTYMHGKICVDLFTHTHNTNAVFSRYFHSITCHSPLLFRIVCLRSVNTEVQERMFGQAKQITRGTSSLKANHIITNIVTRIQAEKKAACTENPFMIQEGEIHKLAKTLGPALNTVIPYSWLEQNPSLHQAHLQRISDFLLPGPAIWWKHCADGIEFQDGHDSPSQQLQGPDIHHLCSTSLSEIDIYLQNKWEECCYTHITLPANSIRQYQPDGSLSAITVLSGTTNVDTYTTPVLHATPANVASTCASPLRPAELINVTTHVLQAEPTNVASTCICASPLCPAEITNMDTCTAPFFQAEPTNVGSAITCTCASPLRPAELTNMCTSSQQTESRNVVSTSFQQPYTTTLAKTLSQVLPNDSTLRQFDLLRRKAKGQQRNRSNSNHLMDLSEKLKKTLLAKYKELTRVVNRWTRDELGHVLANADRPTHIKHAVHKLNLIRKILNHEWKTNI